MVSKMLSYAVLHGVVDWCQPDWSGVFYPEDMPEDWQLSYYQTHFRCVWLPADKWVREDPRTIAKWVGDVHSGFRFILEALPNKEAEVAEYAVQLAAFSGFALGPWSKDHSALVWVDEDGHFKTLAERLSHADIEHPCVILVEPASYTTLERVDTLIQIMAL